MLFLAIYWYAKAKEIEPLIVIIGQVIAVVALASGEINTKVSNQDMQRTKLFMKGEGSVKNKNVSDSYIDIDNK
jgi:hypothetical protein